MFQTTLLLLLALVTPLGSWARSTAAWDLVSFGVALSSTEKPDAPELGSLDSGAKAEAKAEQVEQEQEASSDGSRLPVALGAASFEVPVFELAVRSPRWGAATPRLLHSLERPSASSRGPPLA